MNCKMSKHIFVTLHLSNKFAISELCETVMTIIGGLLLGNESQDAKNRIPNSSS